MNKRKPIYTMNKLHFYSLLAILLAACTQKNNSGNAQEQAREFNYPVVGEIERLDQMLDEIISKDAKIEVLAEGFGWSEGPIWLAEEQKLIFTDVRQSKLYQWTEKDSVTVYLDMQDPENPVGPSALLTDHHKDLFILRYGHGQVVKMNSSIQNPTMDFTVLAEKFNGIRFNNTNDAAFHSNGDMYMSDPPPVDENGLKQAVYRIKPSGEVSVITDSLSSPNGIAFSPGESTIYIANADWQHAIWIAADVDETGHVSNGRKFFDATGNAPKEKGHPDGLKVNKDGIIFATGPGGVYILTPEGKHLGTILNDEFNTNCVLDDKEEVLYITSGPYLMRVAMK